ncbi:MAG TPA: PHB depolymerase family esterase [Acidimicrobiales bacterium]|nr:PHB depolymerase family esterase [Acidimicrobiales bacterium]
MSAARREVNRVGGCGRGHWHRLRALAALALIWALLAGGGVPAQGATGPNDSANILSASTPSRLPADRPNLLALTVDGQYRTFALYRPKSAVAHAPLVILMHGSGSDGPTLEAQIGFDQIAAAQGIVVAYPDALGPNYGWHDQCCQAKVDTPVDLDFVAAIIKVLRASQFVGRQRVVVGGFSSGALMALDVGCKLANQVAAVVSVSGTLLDVPPFVARGLPAGEECAPTRPVALLAVNGSADSTIPVQGESNCASAPCGPGDRGWTPALTTVAYWWARLNGCSQASTHPRSSSTTTTLEEAVEVGCPEGGTVTLVTVNGAGHSLAQIESSYPLAVAIAAQVKQLAVGASHPPGTT